MKKLFGISAVTALSTVLAVAAVTPLAASAAGTANAYDGFAQQYGPPQGPPPQYGDQDRDRGWEGPPGELNEVSRRGFRDGIEGARKDFENHRRPDVRNRDEYRHPNVDRRERRAYRQGFQRGYQVGVQHIYNRGRR